MSSRSLPVERIVLLAEYYASGGTRTYLRHLLKFYAARGTSVTLVGCHAKADSELAGWLDEHGFSFTSYSEIMGENHKNTAMTHPNVWSPVKVQRERAAFRRFLHDVGARGIVVSAGTPGQFAGAAGASSAGIYFLHTYPHGRRQKTLGRWLMKGYFRPVRKLVAVSDYQRREMIRLWGMRGREIDIAVIPNTAGPRVHAPDVLVAPPLNVITTSWLEPYKEPLEWLDVAATVAGLVGRDRVRFTWFGEGGMLETCCSLAEDVRREVDATFFGHCANVEPMYETASVYLQMSSTENMSLSVLDALRFGVPTVSTDVGGLPEIVVDGVTGLLVPAHDVHAAAEGVIRLLDDGELRASMARASQERYAAQFSPERWTLQMTHLHDEVFGADGSRAPAG